MPETLARSFRYCPRCATPAAKVGRNPLECPECGFTFYFSPIVGAVAIIGDDAGRVLLLVRARNPGQGKYGLPGGFVDAGESVEKAIRREVKEEVNLQVRSLEFLGTFPNRYNFRGVELAVTDVAFACTVKSLDPIAFNDGEVHDIKLCRPGKRELNKMAFDANRRALEAYLKRV
jgi:ADP-ribose pyrophosphatase